MKAGDGGIGEEAEGRANRDQRSGLWGWCVSVARHSSARAGPFSHPNEHCRGRIGKPADRPASPPVRCAQENGTPERWARWSIRTTTQTIEHDRHLHEDGHAHRRGREPSRRAPSTRWRRWSAPRVSGSSFGATMCSRQSVKATMPPDMVNTPAIATVYPTATSRAVTTQALAPDEGSTSVMKLAAEGSAFVNSATVKASRTTATPAARIVTGRRRRR